MAIVTKGEFITDILATPANIAAFKAFRTGATELAVAVNEAWESSDNVILTSPFVQGLINAIVPSVLDAGSLERFNAEIARQALNVNKNYTMLRSAVDDVNAWLTANVVGIKSFRGLEDHVEFTATSAPAPAQEVA